MPGKGPYSDRISAFFSVTSLTLPPCGPSQAQQCRRESVGQASDPAAVSPGPVPIDLARVFQLGQRALYRALSEAARARERGARPRLAAAKQREEKRSF